jgi:RNA polymerase-binding transcription factor DksA
MKTRTMKSVIASRRRQLMGSWETQGARTNEVCPRCGAQITPLRLSIREMAVTIVCGGLLLSAFASAC